MCKLGCCGCLKSSHLCLLIETVIKCNKLQFAVELMPTLENQDDSGFQNFFLVEDGHLEERKKYILVGTPFSVTTIFNHLYT